MTAVGWCPARAAAAGGLHGQGDAVGDGGFFDGPFVRPPPLE
jgi:hypothetical protein